ncbi:60S ribosomal protein L13, partial [Ascosphaera acerosa]
EAGIPRKLAPTIGISVDHRRTNKSTESLAANVARLQAYKARLILFPRRAGQFKTLDTPKEELAAVGATTRHVGAAFPIANPTAADAVTEIARAEMPDFGDKTAFRMLRDVRSEARLVGVREKRAKAKADEAEAAKK